MAEIVLCTVNARYSHASLALRCLRANLGELRQRSVICEFVDQQAPADIVEALLAQSPRIVGFSVYIWNSEILLAVARILKLLSPDVTLVIGGPEVSYGAASAATPAQLIDLADHVVSGEGERLFYQLCRDLLRTQPVGKNLGPVLPDLPALVLPYDEYSDEDLAHRTTYVESSRGCPFGCEFCLSSLDVKVRRFDLNAFLQAMERLYQRGARHFKFVDRTFNLDVTHGEKILAFFYQRYVPGMFLHFELVPNQLSARLLAALAKFPAGAVQLELGIQSLDEDVNLRIGRKQKSAQALATIAQLRAETQVHLHVDLVVGLPGEALPALAQHFDRLRTSGTHEIQVGILKKLAGAPIARHDHSNKMLYRHNAPYDLMQNNVVTFAQMQGIKRFSYLWDRIGNSGHFSHSLDLLLQGDSDFAAFDALTQWVYARHGRVHAISLNNLAQALATYLCDVVKVPHDQAWDALAQDFISQGKRPPRPARISPPEAKSTPTLNAQAHADQRPKRQQRHLAAGLSD